MRLLRPQNTKSMMERFQNRHRRGASMSKLENDNESSPTTKAQTPTRLTSSQSSTPLTSRSSDRHSLTRNGNANSLSLTALRHQSVSETQNSRRLSNKNKPDRTLRLTCEKCLSQLRFDVKLRVRDRSTSRVRDASKRHSWSPRSSTHEGNLHSPQSTTASTASGATTNSTTSAARKQNPLINRHPFNYQRDHRIL
ncbi:hypothetical protein EVAR_73795_1 [Eumeta japonica]|uniref:Uncharacterized protein n=1 Tax=Eumeta variegata TaxID=151549 RepID=A0A4C1TB37_EUMVA|nr:hypothetical protein EVAR_73795_1 [Eumeta japonica]